MSILSKTNDNESIDTKSRIIKTLLNLVANHLIWFILIALVLIASNVQGFTLLRNIINIFWAASALGCIVLGMFFIMLVGGIDLSLESIYGFAPTVAVLFMIRWLPGIISPIIAVFLCFIIGSLLGLLNGLISVKLQVNSFLVTLATMLFWRGAMVYWIPEGIYFLPDQFLFIGKERIGGLVPVAILVMIFVYVIAYLLTDKTSFGKHLYAVGNNETAAYIAGINISKIKIITFVIGGFFASIGGLIEAGRISSVIADLGLNKIMLVFAAVILGGTSLSGGEGKVSGVFAAVLVMTIIENMLNILGVDPSIRRMVFGGVLMAAILLASLQKRIKRIS